MSIKHTCQDAAVASLRRVDSNFLAGVLKPR